MSGAHFLFLMTEGLDATVIDSQVVDGLVAVRHEGVGFDLLALADGSQWLHQRRYYRDRSAKVAARTGGAVRVVPMPRKRDAVGSIGATALLLAERLRRGERLVVHARGDYAAYFASLAARRDRGIRSSKAMFNAEAQMKMRTFVAFVMIKDRWEWKSKSPSQCPTISCWDKSSDIPKHKLSENG